MPTATCKPNDDDQLLCCCEYVDRRGRRAHMLAVCCDCEELDELVDRLLSGRPIDTQLVSQLAASVDDRARFPLFLANGAVHVGVERCAAAACFIVLHVTLLACTSLLAHAIIYALMVAAFITVGRTYMRTHRQCRFFYYATVLSCGWLLCAHSVLTLPHCSPSTILLVLVMITISMWLCARVSKAHVDDKDGQYCAYCSRHVSTRVYHCVWLGVCVSEHNRRDYSLMVLLVTACLSFGLVVQLTDQSDPVHELHAAFKPALISFTTFVVCLLCTLILFRVIPWMVNKLNRHYKLFTCNMHARECPAT